MKKILKTSLGILVVMPLTLFGAISLLNNENKRRLSKNKPSLEKEVQDLVKKYTDYLKSKSGEIIDDAEKEVESLLDSIKK